GCVAPQTAASPGCPHSPVDQVRHAAMMRRRYAMDYSQPLVEGCQMVGLLYTRQASIFSASPPALLRCSFLGSVLFLCTIARVFFQKSCFFPYYPVHEASPSPKQHSIQSTYLPPA